MIPDPSNPRVGDVFIDEVGYEVTIGIVGTFEVAYSWVNKGVDLSVSTRAHVAKHWKPPAPQPITVTKWVTYCAVHDHCTLTEDLNDSQGVRWCIKAADDGETCDLRTLTAGGRA